MTAKEKVYRVVEVPQTTVERRSALERGIREKTADVFARTGPNGGASPRPDPKNKP
jgi:hypothetical protein